MNNTQFFNSFTFDRPRFYKYHFTDNRQKGSPTNYIGVMLSGTAEIESKKHKLLLKQGDVFFIPKGMPYQSSWFGNEDEWVTWLSFGFDFFPVNLEGNLLIQKLECDDSDILLLNTIAEEFTVSCKNVGTLYTFLGNILKNMKREARSFDPIGEKALEFMQNTECYSIKDVADYCGISESGLYKIFKKRYDKTPVEMRQQFICEKAKELLTNTNLSVEEISVQLNFSSSSYFRKVMKKCLGKTPLCIRKESRM